MNEHKIWVPNIGIQKNLDVEALYDDYEGFRILLRGEDRTQPMLRIKFDAHLAYRNADEGDRWRTISEVAELKQSSLFIVENSSWAQWFCEECSGVRKQSEMIHYAIYATNDCIDVLAADDPIVEWLD